ncbi:carboxysome shell carbonic anhydrase [Synechococcus sp. CS-197]|uniref:carboxysome shell carbonic anhydrase n=1 Tax=Synechococcus sp. CS-197 TaxID=2847985 RepID=UPI00015259E8|nr:carboxysome shell carbonic anhydrase [Synechococcus sp. CS-197]MCT0251664.1 carboxysome shell carbonic anhydrase [Synechococcus sp. CS-197]CAK23107.1 Carboxysome shell polypeptide, CsoS3 [Synechococcus sp. WH 7803]
MVRSMPFRGGRPQAPTAPTRRQLASQEGSASTSTGASIPLTRSATRSSALQRRQALTTAGKAAVVNSGSVTAGRVRNQQDRPARSSQQPSWVKKSSQSTSTPVNLSRSSLPWTVEVHPLTDQQLNDQLQSYEHEVKGRFDRIVPVLKQVSVLQHEPDFITQAQRLARSELGFDLPDHILEQSWVRPLDMRALFAWCVFQSHQQFSDHFFQEDPLHGAAGSANAEAFEAFLLECGFHLLDVSPCADGRLAHTIAYALRIPFSAVRRRSHAGAMFDVENTVNRWVKTEHRRFREQVPNEAHADTRYLKVVAYHFSSVDPLHQGCAAHGSDDSLAASSGLRRLLDFKEAVENSFCCGASVDLLLIGLDTDTDAIRVHVPDQSGEIRLDQWLCAKALYDSTVSMTPQQAHEAVEASVKTHVASAPAAGMVRFISRLLMNNFSQQDYVRSQHRGPYPDAGHAERFIGVGIGFKEVHLRNLTYFAHLDTVEQGAPDLDVGVKIFKGLNVSRDLPIPVVVRFDYSGKVPGARDRAIADCHRIQSAIHDRYSPLVSQGLLHTLLTVRDRDQPHSAVVVGSTLDPVQQEAH